MHIAIICSSSPPLNHVSTRRAYFFAHHLALLGHRTTLVSADYRSLEERFTHQVDESKISHFIRIDVKEWFEEFGSEKYGCPLEKPKNYPVWLRKFFTLKQLLQGWGPWTHWGHRALASLIKLNDEDKIDIVWATFGDETTHEVAHQFSEKTGVPWVADFKDPWDLGVEGIAKKTRLVHTRRRLQNCLSITENCSLQATADEKTFGRSCYVIPHGFDEKAMDAAPSKKCDKSDRFELHYFGALGSRHNWPLLIELFKKIDSSPIKGKIVFHWFGFVASEIRHEIQKAGLDSYFIISDVLPQNEAFALMKGCPLLFLMPQHNKKGEGGAVGMKELEYIASANHIFCLGKMHQQTKQLIEPQLLHEFVDLDKAVEFLSQAYLQPKQLDSIVNSSDLSRPIRNQSWGQMAEKLSRHFEEQLKKANQRKNSA